MQQTTHSGAFLESSTAQTADLPGTQSGAPLNIKLHSEGTHPMQAHTTRKASMMYLEPDEVLTVLRVAKAKGTRSWAMLLVAYKHGMRASDVCNLRLGDVDLKNGSIVVDRLKGSLRTTQAVTGPVSYTHLRAHETRHDLV